MTAPGDDESGHAAVPEPDAASDHEAAAHKPSAAGSALRGLGRQIRLIVTAIVIVVGLAFGIPWLIGLVWH